MELRLHRYGLVDSTNERALVAIQAGRALHGDVHIAAGQTSGRGRREHRWVSPIGEGLYMSVVVQPERGSLGAGMDAIGAIEPGALTFAGG